MKLAGKVAVVCGASRGAGRGIAVALGDAGATVYCMGRTRRGGAKPIDGAPGTVDDTADEVTARGGRGIAVALGDAGATVHCVGRTRRGGAAPVDGAPGTVDDTADEVTARGGRGIAVHADLTV